MDGYLKIRTKIDNKEVDKGITELENKIKKLQEDNLKSSTEQNSLQGEIDNYEKLQSEADAYKQKIKELNAEKNMIFKSNPALAFQGNIPEYENIKIQIDQMKQKYIQSTAELDKQAPKIDKVYAKLDKVKAKQVENNAKISEYKQKIEKINIGKVQKRTRQRRKSFTVSNRQIRENGNGCCWYSFSMVCSKKCSQHS